MRLRKRLPSDLPQVRDLLSQAGLPAEGLERTEGWVAERGGLLLGHVALEVAGEAAVLRSLVVDPSRRGQGLGARLMAEAEGAAAGRALVLKTDTVGSWMLRRGYRSATLDQVSCVLISWLTRTISFSLRGRWSVRDSQRYQLRWCFIMLTSIWSHSSPSMTSLPTSRTPSMYFCMQSV